MFERRRLFLLASRLPGRWAGGTCLSWGLLGGCFGAPPEAEEHHPNILLVTVCSWRADHLGAYGYPAATSPFTDALAGGATVFESGYSNATFTDAAHAVLFTGMYTTKNGMVDFGYRIRDDVRTLPEILSAYGYRSTGLLTEESHFGAEAAEKMARGFGGMLYAPGAALAPRLASWIAERPDPWLAWVHLRRAHVPYGPGAPFVEGVHPAVQKWIEESARRPGQRGPEKPPDLVLREAMDGDPEVEKNVMGVYDSGLLLADAELGALYEGLEARQLLDDTVVVLVGDHGEALGENGVFGHRGHLVEPVLRIPYVIRVPGGAARRVGAPVSLVDILPTLTTLAGAATPAGIDGISLVGALSGEALPERPILAQAAPFGRRGTEVDTAFFQDPWWLSSTAAGFSLWKRVGPLWEDASESDGRAEAMLAAERALTRGGVALPGEAPPLSDAVKEEMQKHGYW